MNKHKPKFMKIVPPGLMKGSIAPPYAWDGIERGDWSYEPPKRKPLKGLGEGEFDHPKAPNPSPLGHPAQMQRQQGGGSGGAATATNPATAGQHARVDAIHAEIKQIRADITKLMTHKQKLTQDEHGLRQKAKTELQQRQKYGPGVGTSITIGDPPAGSAGAPGGGGGNVITIRESEKGYGGIQPWETPIVRRLANRRLDLNRNAADSDRLLQMKDGPEQRQAHAQSSARDAAFQQHHDSGQAKRDLATRPQGSLEVAMLAKQIRDVEQSLELKHARLDALRQELEQLRQHAQESVGLRTNNLRRLSLLLK